jgi:hypothetical protein
MANCVAVRSARPLGYIGDYNYKLNKLLSESQETEAEALTTEYSDLFAGGGN